jgi:hypothetical protein
MTQELIDFCDRLYNLELAEFENLLINNTKYGINNKQNL